MKPFLRIPSVLMRELLLVFLGIGLGAVAARAGASSSDLRRDFQVTCEVQLHPISPAAQELKVWIPLATSDQFQTIRRRAIQVPYAYQITRDPEYGNDILFLTLRHPLPPTLEFSIQYDAAVRGRQIPISQVNGFSPHAGAPSQEMEMHLRSNRLMVVDDSIRRLAESVTQGASTSEEEARAIYRYVIERMTYGKKIPGWGRGDTLRACEVGAGNCTDFHSLFISLARARGIPARFQIGLPVPLKPEGEILGYHCWAEFYLEGTGWVPVDASEAWKDRRRLDYFFGTYDPNRLAVSKGRDIQLVPKTSNGPVNIFFHPVVEIDGKAFDGVQTKFRFRELAKQEGGDHA